jgi:HK97 family phage major capsid protein
MNSATVAVVRKLKDENNQYFWAPGLTAGQPDRLLGYPVETWEQMDDVGANTCPIAFGDFRRGYLLVDCVGLRITVGSNITAPS